MDGTDTWEKRYAILVALAISVFTAFMLLSLIICLGMIPVSGIEGSMIMGLTVPTIISLYLVPKVLYKFLLPIRGKTKANTKIECVIIIVFLAFCILYGIRYRAEFESRAMMCTVILHYTVVSIGEEFTYRKLIPQILARRYKYWVGIVLSAVMFAFVLHINEAVTVNLLIRFPMGIAFGFIAMKSERITYTVILHTIYNLIVLVI